MKKDTRKSQPAGILANFKTAMDYDRGLGNLARARSLEALADQASYVFSPDYTLADLRAFVGRRLEKHPEEFWSVEEAAEAARVASRTTQPVSSNGGITKEALLNMSAAKRLAAANGENPCAPPAGIRKKATVDEE